MSVKSVFGKYADVYDRTRRQLERMQEDRMATLVDQLRWLTEAGFQEVNCWYKNFNFVVYAGFRKKPE